MSEDLEDLAKGGRTNVAGFFIRLIARIPFLIVASRWYGPEEMGRFAYALAFVEFVAQITTMGLKRGLALHLTGDGKENGAWDAIIVVLFATLVPMALLMAFPQILFPNSRINGLDHLLPLAVPAIAIADIMLAALAYRMDVASSVRARAIIEPWTISIAAIFLWWPLPRDGMLVAYALSMAAALVASIIPFLNSYGLPHNWTPKWGELIALTRRNLPLAAADAIEWGTRRIDVLILGLFVSPATVGIYYVAQQVASLPQKLKTSFDPVLGPVIARKLEEKDLAAVARQISQVGFWILAAQVGVGLALGVPGKALLSAIGPARDFIGGNGALAFLLLAEVAAAVAVVSEAALVYIARFKNMAISCAVIGVQAVLSVGLVVAARAQGLDELFQAAAVALALAGALAIGSIAKSLLAQKRLGAPITILRPALIMAASAAFLIGWATSQLPEIAGLIVGIPAILMAYGAVIWRFGFTAEDRMLFRKT